jgi:hypothetical protein
MQDLLRRYFWVVVVVTIIAAATFAAKTTNHVVEGKYLADPPRGPKVKPPAPSPSTAVATRSKLGQPLVDRNMFCAACLPPVVAAAGAQGPVDPNAVSLTALPLSLIATHVAEPKRPADPANFATILNTGTQKQGAYWVGDDIPGAGKVVEVHYKYVDFTNAGTGRKERVSLTGEVPPPPPPPTTVAADTPPPADGDDMTAAIDVRHQEDRRHHLRDRSQPGRQGAGQPDGAGQGRPGDAVVEERRAQRLQAVRRAAQLGVLEARVLQRRHPERRQRHAAELDGSRDGGLRQGARRQLDPGRGHPPGQAGHP